MGDEILVGSEIGRGTKFTLPVYCIQKINPGCSNNMFEKLGLKMTHRSWSTYIFDSTLPPKL